MSEENNILANFDIETATMADLDNLSIDELLGGDISDYDLSSNLPDGTYVLVIEKYEVKKREAKPEEGKKAGLSLNTQFKVLKCLNSTESNVDIESLTGRVHFESYSLLHEMGVQMLIKMLLGATGIGFKDKDAIKQIGQSPLALLEEMKANRVAFGAQVKTVDRNGYENCNIVAKESAFIDMEKVQEYL